MKNTFDPAVDCIMEQKQVGTLAETTQQHLLWLIWRAGTWQGMVNSHGMSNDASARVTQILSDVLNTGQASI